MESSSSFIPKSTQRTSVRPKTTKRIYLLAYVSYVLFFGTVIGVLAIYLYASSLSGQLEGLKNELSQARNKFATDQIDEIRNLEKKLLLANDTLNNLTSPSTIFTELERVVAENIVFTAVSYEHQDNDKLSVAIAGTASNFNQILYQSDLMNQNNLLKQADVIEFDYVNEATVSDISNLIGVATSSLSDEVGTINFIFVGDLAKGSLPYVPKAISSTGLEALVTSVRSLADSNGVADTGIASEVDGSVEITNEVNGSVDSASSDVTENN